MKSAMWQIYEDLVRPVLIPWVVGHERYAGADTPSPARNGAIWRAFVIRGAVQVLKGLLDVALSDPALARVDELAAGSAELDVTAPQAARSFVVATAARHRPVLAVTATSREAEDLAEELSAFLDPADVAVYPAWETLPHERLSPRSDTVGRRLAVLRRLSHPGGHPLRVVVAPVRSMLQPQLKGLGELEPVVLTA